MEDKKKDWRFWIFLIFSVLWSIRVFWLLIEDQFYSGWHGPMPLNEVGDFLAGSFSPLAFAWLAYGYWMQNRELEISRKNLTQQIEEFKKSVAIQEKMAALAYDNQELELRYKDIEHNKAQPIIDWEEAHLSSEKKLSDHSETTIKELLISFKNLGSPVTRFQILKNKIDQIIPVDLIESFKKYEFRITINLPYRKPLKLELNFLDAMGIEQSINLILIEGENGRVEIITNSSANRG